MGKRLKKAMVNEADVFLCPCVCVCMFLLAHGAHRPIARLERGIIDFTPPVCVASRSF